MKIAVVTVTLVIGGAAAISGLARYQQPALAKADSLAAYVGLGETAISKLVRPAKIVARIDERQCPQGYRDVMEADGSIGGCWRDRGKR